MSEGVGTLGCVKALGSGAEKRRKGKPGGRIGQVEVEERGPEPRSFLA